MADVKISALPASTTPLAGTEVLPIVQGGATKQVSIDNLTAGKEVPASKVTISTGADALSLYIKGRSLDNGSNLFFVNSADTVQYAVMSVNASEVYFESLGARPLWFGSNGSEKMRVHVSGGVSIGNTTDAGAGVLAVNSGVRFSATQVPSADANTLDDYEEGTWTPTQGGGLVVVGTFSSSGTYTKVGRFVFVRGIIAGSTSIAATAGGLFCGGFPFNLTIEVEAGLAVNDNANGASPLVVAGTNIYTVQNIAAAPRIVFNATFVV